MEKTEDEPYSIENLNKSLKPLYAGGVFGE